MGRAVLFVFAVTALLFFFYGLGSGQDFLDSTQLILLSALRVTLWTEIALGAWYAVSLVYRCVTERRALVIRWLLLVTAFSLSAVLLAALQFVRQWLQS
jgi:hypothetical protein